MNAGGGWGNRLRACVRARVKGHGGGSEVSEKEREEKSNFIFKKMPA